MNDINLILDKLYKHYNVKTIKDLSVEMDMNPTQLSRYKSQNNCKSLINKIKKLKIYEEIFYEDSINNELNEDGLFYLNLFFLKLHKYKLNSFLKNKEGFYIVLRDILIDFDVKNVDTIYDDLINQIDKYPKIKRIKKGIIEIKDLKIFLEQNISRVEIQYVILHKEISLNILKDKISFYNR